jgi:hypothetical protein
MVGPTGIATSRTTAEEARTAPVTAVDASDTTITTDVVAATITMGVAVAMITMVATVEVVLAATAIMTVGMDRAAAGSPALGRAESTPVRWHPDPRRP